MESTCSWRAWLAAFCNSGLAAREMKSMCEHARTLHTCTFPPPAPSYWAWHATRGGRRGDVAAACENRRQISGGQAGGRMPPRAAPPACLCTLPHAHAPTTPPPPPATCTPHLPLPPLHTCTVPPASISVWGGAGDLLTAGSTHYYTTLLPYCIVTTFVPGRYAMPVLVAVQEEAGDSARAHAHFNAAMTRHRRIEHCTTCTCAYLHRAHLSPIPFSAASTWHGDATTTCARTTFRTPFPYLPLPLCAPSGVERGDTACHARVAAKHTRHAVR